MATSPGKIKLKIHHILKIYKHGTLHTAIICWVTILLRENHGDKWTLEEEFRPGRFRLANLQLCNE